MRTSIKKGRHFERNKISVINILLNVVLISLLALFVMINFSYFKTGDRTQLTVLGYKPVLVKSGSMEPDIMTNALVLLKKSNIKKIKIDDVAAFFHEDTMIIHKVIEIEEDGLRTKGICNPAPDPFVVTKDMVFGKVVAYTNITAALARLGVKTNTLGIILILLIVTFSKLFKKVNNFKYI